VKHRSLHPMSTVCAYHIQNNGACTTSSSKDIRQLRSTIAAQSMRRSWRCVTVASDAGCGNEGRRGLQSTDRPLVCNLTQDLRSLNYPDAPPRPRAHHHVTHRPSLLEIPPISAM
jgi:hypothetical protein